MSGTDQTNPHALATIVEASASRSIVASKDIFDDQGKKLLSRDQPVSQSLQERLLERKLREPLEACLRAEDGVTTVELRRSLQAFLESDHAIAIAVRPWGEKILEEITRLPLHSVAQLLLTAAQTSKPQVFEHAVRGMALAGAMSASAKATEKSQLRLALLGGLLHDLGEMYVNPTYLDTKQPLDASGYRHLAVHPKVGGFLLSRLTDYPPALTRAITEHHERCDGSGYPAKALAADLSPLGKLLAVMETTLGIASFSKAPWTHASFAMRMIPGEYDGTWVGFVSAAAKQAHEDLDAMTVKPTGGDQSNADQLAAVNHRLDVAQQLVRDIESTAAAPTVTRIAAHAGHLLIRLRTGWNAMGLWATANSDPSPETRFELHMAFRELSYRLRFIHRECLWTESEPIATEDLTLASLWACLEAPLV